MACGVGKVSLRWMGVGAAIDHGPLHRVDGEHVGSIPFRLRVSARCARFAPAPALAAAVQSVKRYSALPATSNELNPSGRWPLLCATAQAEAVVVASATGH
jgi:hypothetical protein